MRGSPNFRLQIADFRFQVADFRLQISDCRLQVTDFRSQISDHRFQIADHRFQILDCSYSDFRSRSVCPDFESHSVICSLKCAICNLRSAI